MEIEEIYTILDDVLGNVESKGEVDLEDNYRCGEVGWYESGILQNFVAMIKKEIKHRTEKIKK